MLRPAMLWAVVIGVGLTGARPAYASVPLTGRAQRMCVPLAPVRAAAARAYDKRLASLRSRGMLDTDPQILHRVRRISARVIAQAIALRPVAARWKWEVHTTSDPQVAAFAMSGGKILIGTHFIEKYQLSDPELAVALGHEIGHVIAEHVREQVCAASRLDPPPPGVTRTVADVIHLMDFDLTVYLRLQPLSRLQEAEADEIGVELAARSGVAPSAIRSFYGKITRGPKVESIFNSHGSRKQRRAFVMSLAAYAATPYRESRREMLPLYAFHQ
jgi:predicted Zn-dependent protease